MQQRFVWVDPVFGVAVVGFVVVAIFVVLGPAQQVGRPHHAAGILQTKSIHSISGQQLAKRPRTHSHDPCPWNVTIESTNGLPTGQREMADN